jgi:hypothetical protein
MSAKLAETGRAIERAWFDTLPDMFDKLKHLEGEENVALPALIDRHWRRDCSSEALKCVDVTRDAAIDHASRKRAQQE